MTELLVILSSFNRTELLKEALASLCRVLPELPIESAVIILDAGSNDGSREHA
jgi:glycosyltransferase involved in cell wall biosynthesis